MLFDEALCQGWLLDEKQKLIEGAPCEDCFCDPVNICVQMMNTA
jgi:hypothetical protein